MRSLIIATTFVALGIASPALAQQKSARAMMDDMKAKYGQTFDQCQALAVSRGFRVNEMGDDGGDIRNLMMFIEGCVMGKQR